MLVRSLHSPLPFLAVFLLTGIACTGTDPDPNQPPTVQAGSDLTASGGDTVTVSGVLSSDPEGKGLTFIWRQLAGPPVTAIRPWTMSNATLRFLAPTDPGDQLLTFELEGSDGKASGFDSVNVLVHNPDPTADPCQNPNAPTVNATLSITFPSGNPARYVGFDGFVCGGSTPWALYGEIWDVSGYGITYTRTFPIRINSPYGSAMHTIRAYWWDTGYSDYSQSSGWITPDQFTMSGVVLSQETTPRTGYVGRVPCAPVKTAICDPAPYQQFWISANGVVLP